jgi:hypothetical protein
MGDETMKKLKILTRTTEISNIPFDDLDYNMTRWEAKLNRGYRRRMRRLEA